MIDDKIQQLRTVMEGCDDRDRETIDLWQKLVKENMAVLSLKDNVGIKKIIDLADKIVLDNRQRLATDRDITDVERANIFTKIDFFEWFLGIFDEAKQVMDGVEREVDKSIEANS